MHIWLQCKIHSMNRMARTETPVHVIKLQQHNDADSSSKLYRKLHSLLSTGTVQIIHQLSSHSAVSHLTSASSDAWKCQCTKNCDEIGRKNGGLCKCATRITAFFIITNLIHKFLVHSHKLHKIKFLYMFRAQSAHHQEVNDANCTYAASGIVTLCKSPSLAVAQDGHLQRVTIPELETSRGI